MSILDLPHGTHRSIPELVYHEKVLGLVSCGALNRVHRTAAHYRAWLDGAERETSEALAFGKAAHCAILEPERFLETYTVEPSFGDCRKKENKANRDAWRAEHEGAVLLKMEDHLACRAMGEAVRSHRLASKLLNGGDAEVTVRWQDASSGLECKARPDYYVAPRRLVVDLKTAEDASPEGFRKACARYGYHRIAAFYKMGLEAVGEPIDYYLFLAVEKEAPFAIGIYTLDEDAESRGRESIRRDLDTLARCTELDMWPGYSESIVTLELPQWA